MAIPSFSEIHSILHNLQFTQTYTWPLTNDKNHHYKFYNIVVHRANDGDYYIHCTWGKINSRGRTKTIKEITGSIYEITGYIYNTLSSKIIKGYKTTNISEYNVITEHSCVYTQSLNGSSRLLKKKEKSSKKEIEDITLKRFNDLII